MEFPPWSTSSSGYTEDVSLMIVKKLCKNPAILGKIVIDQNLGRQMSKQTFIVYVDQAFMRTRPNAMSSYGVTASSSLQASLIGSRIMEEGGNVVDAAIATSAALCVTQNNLCGLGGDLFALIRINGKPIMDYNGSGRAAKSATIPYYEELGLENIPQRGELSAITVPGIVHAWGIIQKNYGTMEFSDLLRPALKLAKDGFPVTHNYSKSVEVSAPHLEEYGWGKIFKPNGRFLGSGIIFKQPDLAATLGDLISEGPDTFYSGHLLDRIFKGLRNQGMLFGESDFKQHKTTVETPLKTNYEGYDIYETNPNSQGATVLLWLNLLSELQENRKSSDEREKFLEIIHAGLIAYEERSKFIADPAFQKLPKNFTDISYARELLAGNSVRYDNRNVSDPGDTTYFTIADKDGNSVSIIQSNYMGFGSGIVPSGTGFVLQNRGCYFSLEKDHHNSLQPGKRTFHTLCAAMAEKDGDFQFSLGTMGGDIQPQIHVQLIRSLIDGDLDPQLSVDAPRWAFPGTIYEKPGKLLAEVPLYDKLKNYDLHGLTIMPLEHHSSQTGHAQITFKTKDGVVIGGSDPRGDGVAIPVLKIST